MRKIVVAGVAALAVLVPVQARAVISLGVRVGYSLPSGDVQSGVPLEDNVSSNVPIQVDAAFSMLDILSLGVYGSFGPSQIASDRKSSGACAGVSCSGRNLRGGVQLNLRPPLVLKGIWGGVFAGVEQQTLEAGTAEAKYTGWEAGLQGGYDFSVLPFIQVGPFLSWSLAEFTDASGAALGAQARHSAFTFGLRGLFDF